MTSESSGLRQWLKPPKVEAYGVDTIPEADRTATPGSFSWIMMGANMSLTSILREVPLQAR